MCKIHRACRWILHIRSLAFFLHRSSARVYNALVLPGERFFAKKEKAFTSYTHYSRFREIDNRFSFTIPWVHGILFPMEQKINGNISGIRDVLLEEMKSLYDMDQPAGIFASRELLEALCAFTGRINREISVYISRAGLIKDVSIGDDRTVSMPEMRLVRNIDRLCGVRCIHTHPNGSGYLSDVDLGTLNAPCAGTGSPSGACWTPSWRQISA